MVQSKPRISSKILGQPLPQRRPRHRSLKILGQPLSQGDLPYHFVDHASMVRWIFVLPDAELFDAFLLYDLIIFVLSCSVAWCVACSVALEYGMLCSMLLGTELDAV